MSDQSLKRLLFERGFDPADGLRRLMPASVRSWSVREFLRTPTGLPARWVPVSVLAKAVYEAGFLYDPGQDIIYSRMNPLQRSFGYAHGYDAAAIGMDAIIDCEPIFFDHAGKHWMIELWKGQYGLETGAEVGVYNRPFGASSVWYDILDNTIGQRTGDPNPLHNLYFPCADDADRLLMTFSLYKNGKLLFRRGPQLHWWLTGFKWGLFSLPEELTMDIAIACPVVELRDKLAGALQGMGYYAQVSSNTVSFRFTKPRSHQPRLDVPALVQAAAVYDRALVTEYNAFGFPNNDPNVIPDSVVEQILAGIDGRGLDAFGSAVARLASSAGISGYRLIQAMAQGFGIGMDEATDIVAQAGDTLTSWLASALALNLDYGCIIEICNKGNPYDLVLTQYGAEYGHWEVPPPARIRSGRRGRFLLRDTKPSGAGATGWAQYYFIDAMSRRFDVRFIFDCPLVSGPNAASATGFFNFYTKTGGADSAWSAMNRVRGGHPLCVAYVFGNQSPPE